MRLARHTWEPPVVVWHMALLGEIRRQVPRVFVMLAGLCWAALIWRGYQANLVTPGNVDAEVVMQYYDRSLRLVEAGQRGNNARFPEK